MQVILRNVKSKTHSADHHRQTKHLCWRVNASDHTAGDRFKRKVQRYGAERKQHDKDDRHHAGVAISSAEKDLVGVVEGLSLLHIMHIGRRYCQDRRYCSGFATRQFIAKSSSVGNLPAQAAKATSCTQLNAISQNQRSPGLLFSRGDFRCVQVVVI